MQRRGGDRGGCARNATEIDVPLARESGWGLCLCRELSVKNSPKVTSWSRPTYARFPLRVSQKRQKSFKGSFADFGTALGWLWKLDSATQRLSLRLYQLPKQRLSQPASIWLRCAIPQSQRIRKVRRESVTARCLRIGILNASATLHHRRAT